MFKVSNILRNTRLDKSLEFKDISKVLKIPVKYLIAIENDDLKNFPQEPYCSLIVKDYATYLGLNGEEVLSIFRRDYDRRYQQKKQKVITSQLTPQNTVKIFVIVITIFFLGYLVFEYIQYNRPPRLTLNWSQPVNNSVEVSGVTDPDSTVRIDQDLVIVNPDGTFKKNILNIKPGQNIVIESKSPSGKVTRNDKTFN